MRAIRDEKSTFKAGMLIIGSLLWDKSSIRKAWRDSRLELSNKISIRLPIRYGRVSAERKNTFTMVFSSGCKKDNKLGRGYFVPFKNESLSMDELISQGQEIVTAEHKKMTDLQRFNWGWGCLGIVANPTLSETNSKEINEWSKKYGKGFKPSDYSVGEEEPIISNDGILKIDWQEELNDYDFVIGTVTKPNISTYPSPEEIAKKIIINEHDEYFRRNRENLIATFQDDDIESVLLTKYNPSTTELNRSNI